MVKSILAFILACFTVALLLSVVIYLKPSEAPVMVIVKGDAMPAVEQTKQAIDGLQLKGVKVVANDEAVKSPSKLVASTIFFTILFPIVSGAILFLYKRYCQLLKTTPL